MDTFAGRFASRKRLDGLLHAEAVYEKELERKKVCTIAVYEKSDGKTYISMMNLEAMGKMYGGDVLEMTQELGPQMEEMLNLK